MLNLDYSVGYGGLNKYVLAGETPITRLSLNGFQKSDVNIYMKREDLSPFFFGGNKVRFYEYLIPEIQACGTQRLVAIGSSYSNNIRMVAAIAQFLQIPCKLFVYLEKGYTSRVEGNLLLAKLCGADIEFVNKAFVTVIANDYLKERESANEKCFLIPNGCHLGLASLGYADVMSEILGQSEAMNVKFDAIYLPVGNGTTIAGLELGKELYGFEGDVVGLAFDGTATKEGVLNFISEVKSTTLNSVAFGDYKSNLSIRNSEVKYGEIVKQDIDVLKKLIQSDGICLDPIYNANPFLY